VPNDEAGAAPCWRHARFHCLTLVAQRR